MQKGRLNLPKLPRRESEVPEKVVARRRAGKYGRKGRVSGTLAKVKRAYSSQRNAEGEGKGIQGCLCQTARGNRGETKGLKDSQANSEDAKRLQEIEDMYGGVKKKYDKIRQLLAKKNQHFDGIATNR